MLIPFARLVRFHCLITLRHPHPITITAPIPSPSPSQSSSPSPEYSCAYLGEKFDLSITTIHQEDRGDAENVHNLDKADLKARTVQVIDIANDPCDAGKYKEEEDPAKFKSKKTERGELGKNWKVSLHCR